MSRLATWIFLFTAMSVWAQTATADVDGHVSGVIRDRAGKAVADVAIEVEPDARWGQRTDSDWEAYSKRHPRLPTLTGKASAKSGADGSFSFSIKVTVGADGHLPTSTVRRDGKTVKDPYVVVKGTLIKKPEYRVDYHTWRLVDGFKMPVGDVSIWRPSTYQVKVVREADGTPAADARMEVSGTIWNHPQPEQFMRQEIKTDANGMIVLGESTCPRNVLRLRSLDKGWAIVPGEGRENLYVKEGPNEGRTISLAPGGSLAFSMIDADTRGPLAGQFKIYDARGVAVESGMLARGVNRFAGVPVGKYTIQFNGRPFVQAMVEGVEVKAGEDTDLKVMEVGAPQSVTINVRAETGEAVDQFEVVATQLSGITSGLLQRGPDGKPIVPARGNAGTAQLVGLFNGKWSITVRAIGFSPAVVEADVPVSAPLLVKLSRGGIVQFSNGKERMYGPNQLLMVEAGAPSRAQLEKMSCADALAAVRSIVDSAGLFPPREGYGRAEADNGRIEQIPPGRYVVFAQQDEEFYRFDNVEIRKDVVTKLQFKAGPSSVRLVLTEGVAPVSSGAFVAFRMLDRFRDRENQPSKPISFRTDAAGAAMLPGVSAGEWQFVSQRVFDWLKVEALPPGYVHGDRVERANRQHRFRVGNGDKCEKQMDIADPARILLTVKVGLAGGHVLTAASVRSVDHSSLTEIATGDIEAESKDGVFNFGLVRPGMYELRGQAVGKPEAGLLLYRRFEVRQPKEQLVSIAATLHKVTVNVKLPRSASNGTLHTGLEAHETDPWIVMPAYRTGKRADAGGKAEYAGIASGRYRAWAYFEARGDGFSIRMSQVIDVAKDQTVNLSVDEGLGTLEIRTFMGKPRPGSRHDDLKTCGWLATAELLGKDGKPVAVAGETRIALHGLSGTPNENRRIDNVPPGAYTLRISGLGIETLLKENVVVPKGGSTSVQAEVMPVAGVTIHVKNLDNDVLANSKVTFEALDVKGQLLALPTCKLVFLPPGDGRCSIDLPHIPLACTRIRLSVEGYKTIEVDVVDEKELYVGRQVELAKG